MKSSTHAILTLRLQLVDLLYVIFMLFQGQDVSLASLSEADDLETTYLKVRSHDVFTFLVLVDGDVLAYCICG